MVFSSLIFLFGFLPLVLLVHFILPNNRWRNIWLLLVSLLFYAWGEGYLVLLMIFTVLINYFVGLRLDRYQQGRKPTLILGLIANLGILAFFKYANFFVDNLNTILTSWGQAPLLVENIPLPIGLSFFTFQAMAYILDVFWRRVPAQQNPLQLGLYIALFPQLIAGPIVRYTQVAKQLIQRHLTWHNSARGLQRFFIGLAKKVLIADQLGYVVDQIFTLPAEQLSSGVAWLGLLCYAGQIYFDFSGYSDMAIGIGRVLGFRFPENFNYPYIAKSVREFWRRWHISLSSWFRDYLYIPLGGNQKGVWRTRINLLLVFFLCGLWHGAAWNFVIWGLWHGLFLALERGAWGSWLDKRPYGLQHAYTLAVVLLGWVFFRAENLSQTTGYFLALFGHAQLASYKLGLFLQPQLMITIILAIIVSVPIYPILHRRALRSNQVQFWSWLSLLGLLLLMMLTVVNMLSNSYSPFIYFRF